MLNVGPYWNQCRSKSLVLNLKSCCLFKGEKKKKKKKHRKREREEEDAEEAAPSGEEGNRVKKTATAAEDCAR